MAGKKETVYYFFLNLFSKVLTYALLLAFANLFSVIDYGYASFALVFYAIITTIGFPGLTTVFIPYFVKGRDVHSIFYFSGLAAAAMAIGTAIVSLKYPLVLALAPCFLFTWLSGICRSLLRAEHKYHYMQATEILFLATNVVLTVLLRGFGDYGIIYSFAVSTFVTAVVCVALTWKRLLGVASKPQLVASTIKDYLIKGISVLVLLLSFDVMGRSDSVILGALSSFENVARYNIVSAIAGVLTAISMSVSMFLLTRSSELEESESGGVFRRSMRITFALNLLSAIALCSVITPVMAVFFKQYAGNEAFVAILAASAIPYALYLLYITQLTAHLKPENALFSVLVAVGVNVLLDVVLIPYYGLWGICFATLCASCVGLFLSKTGLGLRAKLLVVSSTLFVFAAYLLGVAGLLLMLPAVFFVFKAGLLTREDVNAVLDVFKKMLARLI